MASEASAINSSHAGDSSFAEQLQKKHQEPHSVTMEEVPDEDDPNPPAVTKTEDTLLSEKASGKQKAKEPVSSKPQALDTRSEELFPSLGSGTKVRNAGLVSPAWGSQKPSTVTNGVNGTNRTAGPTSRPTAPATSAPALANYGRAVKIPGKVLETVTFAPSQLIPREKLKKPVPELLRDINKRSKATVTMIHGPDGGIKFESNGPNTETAQAALRELASQIGVRSSVRIPVPAIARAMIIGKQGVKVQEIIKKSGATVRVPKLEEVGHVEDDDDLTIDVVVEGDPISAEIARRDIEAIVKERTSTMNTRLRDVPAEFYPFIAGPFNSALEGLHQGGDVQVKIPPYHSWSKQGPPQLDDNTQRPIFAGHPSSHIQVSGNREHVQRVKADIERQVNALRQEVSVKQLPIEKNRHQFIAGDNDSIHGFLERNGCYVILPQDSDDTDFVTLIGPESTLDRGEADVIELAMKMQHQLIDIARLHNKAPSGAQSHARALTNYLRQKQAIAELEKLYNSRIVLPTAQDGPVSWEVYSSDGTASYKAKSDITNIIQAHPPSRFRHLSMDPFYHQHVQENLRSQLRQQHGVHLVLPQDDESEELVIVYEGIPQAGTPFEIPRQRPTPTQVSEFEQALQQAQQMIEQLIVGQQAIESRPVTVPPQYNEKVNKYLRNEQRGLPEGTFPIQFVSRGGRSDIRGPADQLASHVEKIHAFIESEKADEAERGHVTSFEFPQKHANFLIGKRGENINKLRDEFDVDIQVNEGKVDIKGPPKKAAAAKSRILALSKRLDDEATHHLKISPQYHRELIGSRGSQVNRLQERYNVRIQFPRSAQNGHDDDASVANGSEIGGPRNSRTNQAPDEVIIRGPKKGADAAKEELESLLKYTQDNSHSATVSVAQSQLPSLIGTAGREMDSIRQVTGAKIDVPNNRDAAGASGRVELKLKGNKAQVEAAKKLLQERAKVFDESTTKTINVDKKHHRAIIGAGGSNLRRMVLAAGGPSGDREQNRTVKVPKADNDDTTIRVEGNKTVVDKIIAEIEKIVAERENQVIDTVEVAPERHRHLIGPRGETRRKLETELGVSIEIPKESVQGPARSQIKLSGPPEKIAAAKEHLTSMFQVQEGEAFQVPRAMHHSISDNGRFFVRLRNDYSITVDHAGQQPPPKPSTQAPKSSEPLPLITDTPEEQSHTWSLQEGTPTSDAEGEIPWILRGSPENVAKAKAAIQKALENAKGPSATGYLVLSDPSTYRLVIGSGGSQINSIRKQTGCKINVPRSQEPGQAIEIIGTKDGVVQAKDIILEIVEGKE